MTPTPGSNDPKSTQVGTAADLVLMEQPLPPERQPALVYLARLALSGRRTMRGALANVSHLLAGECGTPASRCACILTLPWHRLRYAHTAALRALLAERFSPRGANKHLCAIRGVLKEAWRLDLIDPKDYARAIDVKAIRGSTLPSGRALSDGEIRSLFAVCADDPDPAGARDAALLAVLFAGGLRRTEAVGLDVSDIDLEEGGVHVRSGKGRKDRQVFIARGALEAVKAWLAVRGAHDGPLFHPIRRGGLIEPRRLSAQSVLYMASKRAKQAGVAHFSPHDLRRSMVSSLLDSGADLSVVQKLAGHSSPSTTARYDRRPEAAKRRAAGMLAVPYQARAAPPRSA